MRNKITFIAVGCILFLFLVFFGPIDAFSHGFYPDEIDVSQITDVDKLGMINVDAEDCIIRFSPIKDHFAGVELFLVNHVPENGGIMTMRINDSMDQLVETVDIDLSKVQDSTWYKVYIKSHLEKDSQYTASFTLSETGSSPSFLLVDNDYLSNESISGNVLISYAYKHSTFSLPEKIMLSVLIISLFTGITVYFCKSSDNKSKVIECVALYILLTIGLSWNYMYNSFDKQNLGFDDFQVGSETLVSGMIYAERDGICFTENSENGYGLGLYYDLKGECRSYDLEYLTDDNWLAGYNRTLPEIIINSNPITKEISVVGNYIMLGNGEEFQITDVSDDGSNIVIRLNAERVLSQYRNGNLDDAVFFDANHDLLNKSLITAYKSQYGLQGKIFRHLSRHMSEGDIIPNLHLICAVGTAAVLTIIVLLLDFKYNHLFAGCFYISFALSPWIVNYARNLYWVEFTWFLPMAIGILCSLKIKSVKWRIGCYAAAFVSILIKCLCGYEYISVVMMGLISFMVVDLLMAVIMKDNQKAKLLFKSVFILGVVALIGFMVAICIHALLKGNGSVVEGIKTIIKTDVLRRTNGADLNYFDPVYWPSMNSSVWEVFSKYFHFSTEIITGVTGNLFPLLCIIPIVILVYEFKKGITDYQSVFMYSLFFLTSISWFCLAKSHSYIHTHMNFVLWYFGFVQICFYIIVSRIVRCLHISSGKSSVTG